MELKGRLQCDGGDFNFPRKSTARNTKSLRKIEVDFEWQLPLLASISEAEYVHWHSGHFRVNLPVADFKKLLASLRNSCSFVEPR